jgi:uncharacterized oxidoreductase
MTGNTMLITGGGSGIGQALAKAFHDLGNQVVITGRRREALDETTAANPGMRAMTLDIEDAEAIRAFSAQLVKDLPALNVVIHNAGIMREEDVKTGQVDDAEAHVFTNLLGPIRLTAALLPHLLAQPEAAILTVSSGLAFVPLALNPTYCATKAAIHSYTQSLRYQLQDTKVQVIELAPPYVQTYLQGERQAKDPNAMPLKDYIAETIELLTTQPEAQEILVERVKPLRTAESSGNYAGFYRKFNETMIAARTKKS